MVQLELAEDTAEEQVQFAAQKEVILSCNCKEGQQGRMRIRVMDNAETGIEEMFRTKLPATADLFQAAKDAVYEGSVDKIVIKDENGGTAKMSMTKAGIKVTYTKTNVTELSTGL